MEKYSRYLGGMHATTAIDETLRELLIERVETEGLHQAIRRYGPFIATSVGQGVFAN